MSRQPHARWTNFMGRTSDPTPIIPPQIETLPTHLWHENSVHFRRLLSIQTCVWCKSTSFNFDYEDYLHIVKVHFWEEHTLIGFWTERKHCERLVCPLSTSLTVRNLLHSAFCLRIIFDHPHRVLYRVIFATGKMKYVSSRNKNDLVNMTSGIIVRRHRDASCALNPSDAVVISPRPDLSENEWNSKITSSRGLWCWPA